MKITILVATPASLVYTVYSKLNSNNIYTAVVTAAEVKKWRILFVPIVCVNRTYDSGIF